MADLVALRAANERRWALAEVTRPFNGLAKALFASKLRYKAVEAITGVPWFIIAVIHERESSQSWRGSLAQGDPWNRVSVHVPAGRGPFASWEEAAIDALADCQPYLARHKDWSLGGALVALERYNGLGYANRGKPSPYLWAGTNQYGSGKFTSDGEYEPGRVDTQPGCAGLILAMMPLDATIKFGDAPPPALPVLRKGAKGEYVKLLQSKLGFTGKDIDGDFGVKTETALKVFQAAHNLTVDGICGPATWKALG